MKRDVLARRVIRKMKVLAVKLADLKPDVRALWREFESLKPGETILGCRTKKHFCAKYLNRTTRAIQYMLQGGNPNNTRREIISPQADTIVGDTLNVVSRGLGATMVNYRHNLLEHLQNRPLQAGEQKALLDIYTTLKTEGEWFNKFAEEIEPYVQKKEPCSQPVLLRKAASA